MEALLLVLLMLAAVLISSVIDQLVPKVSSPLIQILLGLGIAVIIGGQVDIVFDESELFLCLFIAPLLYDEARRADKGALWHNRWPIVSLALGLVVAIMLAVGSFVHAIIPSISLAAAFALGAALGPTDAVAVASVAKDTDISARSKSILQGESLINDASGIVAFQFATAAAVAGTFSLVEAAGDFALTFFGGIAAGIVLGLVGNLIVRIVRSLGLENSTFHVLFELFTPFIVFLAVEQLHVSGILAVVAAGLVNSAAPREIGPAASRHKIVSTSVWHVFSFTLNGIVFVLLGTQLPRAMQSTWENVAINNVTLIGYILAIAAILVVVRFVWVLVMERIHDRRAAKKNAQATGTDLAACRTPLSKQVRSAAIMTLGGPKGAITLAVIFTLPHGIAQSQLITFMACGVIVVTLLLATFIVPVLAPKSEEDNTKEREKETQVMLDVLRTVVEELSARQTPENRIATQVVIRSYNDRIARIKDLNGIDDEPSSNLRLKVLAWEQECVLDIMAHEKIDHYACYQYLARIAHMEDLVKHHAGRFSPGRMLSKARTWARQMWHRLVHSVPGASLSETTQAIRDIQMRAAECVIEKLRHELESSTSTENAEEVSALLIDYQRVLRTLRNATPSITAITSTATKAVDVERLGLTIELEQIQTRYDDGDLTRASAKRLRENVMLMQMGLEDAV